MKSVLVLPLLVALTHGRPEPPTGYNYPPPLARHGAPSGGHSQESFESFRSGGSGSFSAGSFAPSTRYGAAPGSQSQGSFESSISNTAGFGGGSVSSKYAPSGGQDSFESSRSSSSVSASGFGSAGSFSAGGSGFGAGFGGSFNPAQTSSTQSSGQSSRSSFGVSADSIIVNKHIYVHIPPPELEEEAQARTQVRLPPPQKNYKIIFIKAPSAPASQAPIIPPIPQNEEKTLVYVLVKKPEEQADIAIPTAAPTEPSKPEVYFIKYKTQKESGGQQGAAGIAEGGDDSVVVEAAGKSSAHGQAGAGEGHAGQQYNGAGDLGYSYPSSSFFSNRQGGGSQQRNAALAEGDSYSSSSSSNGISRQYGAPSSNGPY